MKTWHARVVDAHLAVTDQVSHGGRMKSDRYFVWQEQGREDLQADGRHAEKKMRGWTDLFSRTELDPWAEQLGDALDAEGIAWRLDSVSFEPETGFWHWLWEWAVAYG